MKKVLLLGLVISWMSGSFMNVVVAGTPEQLAPTGLMVELLASPDRVSVDGERASTLLGEIQSLRQIPEFPVIRTSRPHFSWIVGDTSESAMQSAYQVLMASSPEQLQSGEADVWDSGKVESNRSTAVEYQGPPLRPNTTYFWKVRTWNRDGEASPYSRVQQFRTGELDQEYATSYYPLEKGIVKPKRLTRVAPERYFVDFGKAAFGRVRITLSSSKNHQQVFIHLGEVPAGPDSIDRNPGGSRRYKKIPLTLQQGIHTYTVRIPPDERNTGPNAIKMPEYTGEVMPFRYCEIEGYSGELHPSQIRQVVVHYPFNGQASSFWSSNQVLNDVWDLCKYSIKATSLTGIYIDGDRERIPYEADAYINQLAHYGVDREYTMARRSHEYLITHPTWPTEWIMHSVLMAWEDYMYTGDPKSLEYYYEDLQAKTLIALKREDGLISTRTGLVTDEELESIHFDGELRDIVDWPHTGILGLNEGEGGETDGYVFTDINTVVNAFHYRALILMSRIAEELGNQNDTEFYSDQAAKVKASFNEKLLDDSKGYYVDGESTDHSSLHANMFPLAFGLVPEGYKDSVVQFIRSRGMACSVYGAQYLLDGLYEADADDYALELL
ncbi:MAG TPA: family 78 glycoside hydrolase catalytic domain, partial [bacterium]|nr:family 78 glycoside hydrolase catalytic domain [bacterium]